MWNLLNRTYSSRLIPFVSTPAQAEVMAEALEVAGAELVVWPLPASREAFEQASGWLAVLRAAAIDILPAAIGCRTASEAIAAAEHARTWLDANWIHLAITAEETNRQTDLPATLEAAAELTRRKFEVLASTSDDLIAARKLVDAGCIALMPRGRGIVSGASMAGPRDEHPLRLRYPDLPLIADRGIQRPSEAALALERGLDAVIVEHAIENAPDPISAAEAFADAVIAGHLWHESGSALKY